MDLPERMLPRIASRLGLHRISFGPYSHTQLQQILATRLEGIPAFDKQAVEFASRKVGPFLQHFASRVSISRNTFSRHV